MNDSLALELDVLLTCFGLIGIGKHQIICSKTSVARAHSGDANSPLPSTEYLRKTLRKASRETIDSFVANNREQYEVQSLFGLDDRFVIFTQEQRAAIFSSGGWDGFRMKYPRSRGILECSRVGFRSDQTQALVYVGQQVDYLAGHGVYVLFARANGTWTELDIARAWVS